jgi:DNA-directed RNA polymerase subunit alpha
MVQALDFDLKQVVLSNDSFGPREIHQIVQAIAADYAQHRVLRDAVAELEVREDQSPASMVRLGVCLFLLGRYSRAVEVLRQGDGGALAHYYVARSQASLDQFDAAVQSYQTAKQAGYNSDDSVLGCAEALRHARRPAEALQTLDALSGAVEQTAEYLYQRGATVAMIGGNPSEVVALYERAVEADKNHAGALFGLALENDRYGNDDTAMDLYRRSVSRNPAHVGALLNLGLLYEEREQYERAVQCYQRILDAESDHPCARLYMRDAQASGDMYYDEDAQKKRDRMGQVLSIPVTDFELSVRSRNCLQKMGVMTLGDLCRCTEQELLASKNFGETSLIEIREMLTSKGLRLGVLATERPAVETYEPETLSPDEQALLSRSIADLALSVRARKCMVRLGISTVGELLRRTGDELLECKNFGVTSLNEVREKLAVHSLKLRGD